MSGRKQHFIPQSLLRGFALSKGKNHYVVAYTHDRGIFTPGTDGIGAEHNFYSELDVLGVGDTLDDKITDYEQSFPHILAEFRSLSNGGQADAGKAAEFVTHLVVRNDHFRKAVVSGTGHLVQGIAETFSDEGQAAALLGLNREQPSEMFSDELAKMWAQIGAPFAIMGMTEAQFNAWVFQAVKGQFSDFFAQNVGPLQSAFKAMAEKLPEVAADAQRRTLSNGLAPGRRVEQISVFSWEVLHPRQAVALPDCVAVAVDASGSASPLILADVDSVETIYMPLSSDRLLVGSRSGTVELGDSINEHFAACSWDFFVARDRTPELEHCHTLLRTQVSQFLVGTIEEVIEDAKAEHRGK